MISRVNGIGIIYGLCCCYAYVVLASETNQPAGDVYLRGDVSENGEKAIQQERKTRSVGEPDSESERQPTADPPAEGEPDGVDSTTHSAAEAEANPEGEATGESEPAGRPEGEGKGTAGPEPEEKAGAEGTGRAEGEVTANAQSETKAEPEGYAEEEGKSEGEGEGEAEAEGEERPEPYEILLPPITLMVIIILGLIGLSVWTKRSYISSFFKIPVFTKVHDASSVTTIDTTRSLSSEVKNLSPVKIDVKEMSANEKEQTVYASDVNGTVEDREFFTDFDLEVLASLGSFNSRPLQLIRVATPALLSLALCPATLYLYQPLVKFFWRPDAFPLPPDINEAIACFLAPAGLVYATSFGFAFSQALTKQQNILSKMTHELGLLDQIVTLTSKLDLPRLEDRMGIYKAVKAEAIFVTLQVMNTTQENFRSKPVEDVTIKIWCVIDYLRRITKSGTSRFDVDVILANKIIAHILELNSICSDRMGTLHARIHPLKWAFLESLGFFSFFGILLLQAQSYRTELTMCIITVFSISLLCYVVSDLDSPFCGFFRIDLSVLPEVIMRVRKAYELAKQGHNVLCTYPEKNTSGYD